MSENQNTAELAYLLWEKQGRPLDRSAQNWLEAEYRAHSPIVVQQPIDAKNEADLRMRGLGSITASRIPSEPVQTISRIHDKNRFVRFACLAGLGLAAAGAILSLFNRQTRASH